MVEHIQQMAASSMHAVKLQQECQAIASSMHNVKMAQECQMAASSPPSDAPTPLPPPMPNIISRYCGNPITYLLKLEGYFDCNLCNLAFSIFSFEYSTSLNYAQALHSLSILNKSQIPLEKTRKFCSFQVTHFVLGDLFIKIKSFLLQVYVRFSS